MIRDRITNSDFSLASPVTARVGQFSVVPPNHVAFSKGGVLLGRDTGAGYGEEITLGENLSLVAGVLSASGAVAGLHAASHSTAGADPLSPADIGAATTAQGGKADTALQTANTTTGGFDIADAGKIPVLGNYGQITVNSEIILDTQIEDSGAAVTNRRKYLGVETIDQLVFPRTADGFSTGRTWTLGNAGTIAVTSDFAGASVSHATTAGSVTGESATFSSGAVMLWGSSSAATRTNLGAGTAGDAAFTAATKAALRDAIFEQPTLGTATCPAGWTDNGNGSYTAITSGQVIMTIPVSGIVDGGVYAWKFRVTARTQGSLTPFLTGVGANITHAASGNTMYIGTHSALVPSMSSSVNLMSFRTETFGAGFFGGAGGGTISDIKLIRIY